MVSPFEMLRAPAATRATAVVSPGGLEHEGAARVGREEAVVVGEAPLLVPAPAALAVAADRAGIVSTRAPRRRRALEREAHEVHPGEPRLGVAARS